MAKNKSTEGLTFKSTYDLLYYLFDKKLIKEVSFGFAGMGHTVDINERISHMLSKEEYGKFEYQLREFFLDFFEYARHPDFNLPPNDVTMKFIAINDEEIAVNMTVIWRWDNNTELFLDKKFIREYGGKINKDGDVIVNEDEWPLTLKPNNRFFKDKRTYTLISK